MDFTLSSEQAALRESVERFIERDYGWEQRHAVISSTDGLSSAHWGMFAELGWLGAGLAEEVGGFGGGAVENAILLESFGRGLVVEPMVAHIVAANVLARSNAARAAELLREMIMGERRVVLAHGEGMRDSLTATQTRFAGQRISGRTTMVEGAGGGDMLIVSAIGDDGVLALYLVDPASPGVSVRRYRTIDNHRAADIVFDAASPVCALTFDGDAGAVLSVALDQGIVALCAEAVGSMEAALMMTRDYLQTRKQFGVAIGSFQALQHRMADMLIDTEMARSILYHALGAMEDDTATRRSAVAAAKALIGPAGVRVAAGAIQLHGGIGMSEEYAVGHFYKRLYAIERLWGDSALHLESFATRADVRL